MFYVRDIHKLRNTNKGKKVSNFGDASTNGIHVAEGKSCFGLEDCFAFNCTLKS